MRLFVAIEPDQAAIKHLQRMQEVLCAIVPGRWTPGRELHLTLKFLGETADEELPGLIEALGQIHIESPIHLRITGVVCFPPHGSIRIVAAAMEDEEDRCARLAGEIDEVCHGVGFKLENRRWKPHITLARVKERTGATVRGELAAIGQAAMEMEANQFQLVESRLSDGGATYVTVASFE